jgi:hypothetical protein
VKDMVGQECWIISMLTTKKKTAEAFAQLQRFKNII